MILPAVSVDQVRSAMARFDAELRSSPQWAKWETNKTHRFALKDGEHLYPVKQIVSMSTGVPVSSFHGGHEANTYLRDLGFEIEPTGLPTEIETATSLHELLLERHPHSVTPIEAYSTLAQHFHLSARLREQTMPDGRNHWENHVQYARRKLVSDNILDGSELGVWKLKVRSKRRVWIEKASVRNRADRLEGEYALGKALWSPARDRSGGDEYWSMRDVQPGDLVIHLVDNRQIAGVSVVKTYVSFDFEGLPNTAWAGMDGYLVRLEDYQPCDPPVPREAFLGNPQLADELRRIRAAHKNLFYDRDLNLNQGFYLTPAPDELVALLNSASVAATGHLLPHIRSEELDTSPTQSEEGQQSIVGETPSPRVWLYAPGRDAEHWDEFYRDGLIAIGWNELGDLSAFSDQELVAVKMQELYERDSSPTNDARACYEFSQVMRPGDLVFAKRGRSRIVGYGTVLGDYRFEPTRENYQHVRRMRWDGRGQWPLSRSLAMKTLTDISHDAELVQQLRKLVELDGNEDEAEVAPLQERTPFKIDDALEGLFLERTEFERVLNIWKIKRNLIIQGPPGVGKTFIAKRLAYALMGFKDPSRVGMVQFHQSYGYEDFVQGYRPTPSGLVLRDGLFLDFCRRAARDPDTTFVFIIDEINRGNLSRILGELMMLIEPDKRGSNWSVPLTYSTTSEAQFFVPENVFLLGLMNTADRSLAMVDYALRRRFAFWTLSPNFGSQRFQQLLVERGMPQRRVDALINCIERINKEIAEDTSNLGPGFRIGHSYFCQEIPEDTDPLNWMKGVVETEIIPLLSEYWIDDPSVADRWAGELNLVLKEQ
jgi:MoxR-like ATPase